MNWRAFPAVAIIVAGCAGRDRQQIAIVEPQDQTVDCFTLNSEIEANQQRLAALEEERQGKVAQNVAAGVAGVFIWPLWFAMDFKGAAAQDEDAVRSRQNYLIGLAVHRGCGVPK